MTIDIEYETETAFGIDYRAVIERGFAVLWGREY